MDASQIHVSYDPEADAAYIGLGPRVGRYSHTMECEHGVLLDIDHDGNLVGIEVLGASASLLQAAADGGRAAVREHAGELERLADQ